MPGWLAVACALHTPLIRDPPLSSHALLLQGWAELFKAQNASQFTHVECKARMFQARACGSAAALPPFLLIRLT